MFLYYTIITGASSGIGFELAKIFVSKGKNVIIVSANSSKLESAKRKLDLMVPNKTKCFVCDLAQKDSVTQMVNAIHEEGIQIDTLINNAGIGIVGEFLKLDPKQEENMLALNINSLVNLTRVFAFKMQNGGRILNVASTGAFQAGPYISTYYASKAFIHIFSEGLRAEFKHNGIQVCTLYPGATKTEFSKRAGKKESNMAMSPETVARIALQPLLQNPMITPAFENVIPALFGAMAFKYFRKKPVYAVVTMTVLTLIYCLVPSLIQSVSVLIIPVILIMCGLKILLNKLRA